MKGIRIRALGLGCALAFGLAACGGDGSGSKSTPTATMNPTATTEPTALPTESPSPVPTVSATVSPTAVPTVTPTTGTQASVAGMLVVRRDVGNGTGDALENLPAGADVFGHGFDRVLSHADWAIDGTDLRGETDSSGRFSIGDLEAGRYHMQVTKTVDGNLVFLDVPVVVGDQGADILAEIALGQVKATSTYLDGGDEVSETIAPNGTRLILRNGRVVEFGDYARTWTDPDGDGLFETANCGQQVYACEDDGFCREGLVCGCTASCQFCDDCGPAVCRSPGAPTPYSCRDDGSCGTGDVCVCVPSCEDCLDCLFSVCVPSCEPVAIESVEGRGPDRLVQGQTGYANAVVRLSDGSEMDVTWLAAWASSDPSVATVDGWGTIESVGPGSADVTATFAEVESSPLRLEVVERPALLNLHVQNTDCFYPPVYLPPGAEPAPPTAGDAFLPPPGCGQVVRIGASLRFTALGEFEGGYYEDVTDEVEWHSEPAAVGTIEGGVFTGEAVGTASISASLGAVQSEAVEVRVVDQPTIVSLSIYPVNYAYDVLRGGPVGPVADVPCFELNCGYGLTLLRGDQVPFHATAHYDTGEWEDVTDMVTWRSSDTSVATIDTAGLMTAQTAGDADIDASLEDVTSAPVTVRVVNEATLLYLSIYQDGHDRVVGKGEQAIFRAVGGYDVGFERDVTDDVTWRSSDESIGRFAEPGVLVGQAAGTVAVSAELDGVTSQTLSIEVFETSELDYCDPSNVNRGNWSDDFNRVVLESDCADYTQPDVVTLRFTVTEHQYPGGIFDPCLDLFAYRDGERVRTIRDEGCGEPFLAPGAPEADEAMLKYQVLAFWDLKDEHGDPVPPGTYTIYGRFYLYFDPVVSIDVTVN